MLTHPTRRPAGCRTSPRGRSRAKRGRAAFGGLAETPALSRDHSACRPRYPYARGRQFAAANASLQRWSFDDPDQRPRTGAMPGKRNVPFQRLGAVRAKVPAVDEGRHAHRHHDPCGTAARSFPPGRPPTAAPTAKPGLATCSKNAFSNAGMSPSQSGNTTSRCSAHVICCCAVASEGGRIRTPIPACCAGRKVQPGHVERPHFVTLGSGTIAIAPSQRVQK